MEKTARKPSSDPVQETLRGNKADWNKKVSLFISEVIQTKKLMNGAPNKFNPEKSRIQFPIPANPSGILNDLARQFQEITQEGMKIVQEQDQYSKTRMIKRKEQGDKTLNKLDQINSVPPPAPATPNLTEQLSAWKEKYDLTKLGEDGNIDNFILEASSPLSRFWTRLTTPKAGFGQGAQKRRLRREMLEATLKSYKALGKLQVQAVKSSKGSVEDIYNLMKQAWNDWTFVSRSFNNYVNTLSITTKKEDLFAPTEEEGYSPEKEEKELTEQGKAWDKMEWMKKIISDYNGYGYLFMADYKDIMMPFGLVIESLKKLPKQAQLGAADHLINYYVKTIKALNNALNIMGTSFKDISTQLTKNKSMVERLQVPQNAPKPTTEEVVPPPKEEAKVEPQVEPKEEIKSSTPLETTAQAFLRKWIGKNRHQIVPGKSSGVRLQIFEMASKTRKNLNQVMDSLQKGLDPNILGQQISEVNQQMSSLRSQIRSLFLLVKPDAKINDQGYL